jgi:hypothetical protein
MQFTAQATKLSNSTNNQELPWTLPKREEKQEGEKNQAFFPLPVLP